jgi:hypothetical protein
MEKTCLVLDVAVSDEIKVVFWILEGPGWLNELGSWIT